MNTDIEVWKPVVGFEEQYEISLNGIVKRVDKMQVTPSGLTIKKGKTLKTRINNRGYVEVRLSKKGKQLGTFIHILLAKAFIPNPHNKPEVNHLNGIKTDNSIDNLEWCTHAENIRHAFKTGLNNKLCKPIIDTCTGKTYKSLIEAATELSINYSTFKNYLGGYIKNKTCLEYLN